MVTGPGRKTQDADPVSLYNVRALLVSPPFSCSLQSMCKPAATITRGRGGDSSLEVSRPTQTTAPGLGLFHCFHTKPFSVRLTAWACLSLEVAVFRKEE